MLGALTGLVIVLSFVTYGLFHSFTAHRAMLETRWRQRGEAALADHRPHDALNDLHSALAYAPDDDRSLQVELATALAASGRTQEAQVYFTTLLESQPGNGNINLQLARLAIKQGNAQAAVEHYQAAIDGTWNGDAFTRRREIRLELANFLIQQGRFAEARSLLLITAGNGPDNHPLQLIVAGLLERAQDPADAFDVYRRDVTNKATRLQALEGEARTAEAMGRWTDMRTFLNEAVNDPALPHQAEPVHTTLRSDLEAANGILALLPLDTQPIAEQARRIAHAAALAEARLLACTPATPGDNAAAPTPAAGTQRTTIFAALGDHLQRLNPLAQKTASPVSGGAAAPAADSAAAASVVAPPPPAAPADPISVLAARWTALPTGAALLKQLADDPVFARNTMALVFESEQAAARSCGAPTGQDALLLRVANVPLYGAAQGEAQL